MSNLYRRNNNTPISELTDPQMAIAWAFNDTVEIIDRVFGSITGETILLTEFIALTHMWKSDGEKRPGLREHLRTFPLLWIRISSNHVRRWFLDLLCRLVARGVRIPLGASYGEIAKSASLDNQTMIFDGMNYERALIQNYIMQPNDQKDPEFGPEGYKYLAFNPRVVVDVNPAPFKIREHTLPIDLVTYTHELFWELEKFKQASANMEIACKDHLRLGFLNTLFDYNPAQAYGKVSFLFERITEVLETCHAIDEKQLNSVLGLCRKVEHNRLQLYSYDYRYEILILTSTWVAANSHRFEDGFFPLPELVEFIASQRRWSKPMDAQRLSRFYGEEDLVIKRERRDEPLVNPPQAPEGSIVGTETPIGPGHADVDENSQIASHDPNENLPIEKKRNQVKYLQLDVPKLMEKTSDDR